MIGLHISHGDISQTALTLVADICIIAVIIFIIFKFRMNKHSLQETSVLENKKPATVITSKDIRAIAGDDMMITQLDLARAYIELGKKKLAKQILDHVIKHGNPSQQQSARQLMASF